MLVIACALVCGGVGAFVGAALLSTENGKKLDDNLYKAFEFYDTRVAKYLSKGGNEDKKLEEK